MDNTDALDVGDLLPAVIALARRAGVAIMDVYTSGDFDTSYKEDDSPLTKADCAAHYEIVEGLQALTPEIPVLSEESTEISFDKRRGWRVYWLVDPLDGTKEFVKRNGQFTVNIALVKDGAPILGVVHAPAFGATWYAGGGGGSFKQEKEGEPVRIRVADYREGTLSVAASRSHVTGELLLFLERLPRHERMSVGSSLKFCLVAEGAAHLYPRLGPTMEWDTAAAQCVVEQAGGSVTDLSGAPLRYNKESLLNPLFMVTGDPPFPWEPLLSDVN